MAKSYLYGNKFKLYGVNRENDDTTGMINDFANAIELTEIEYLIPSVTGSGSMGKYPYLYKWDNTTKTSIYQEEVAQRIDKISKNWQLGTIFYTGADVYSGNLPVQQILNLYPYRINFDDFGYTTIYMTRDDINTVWALHLKRTESWKQYKQISFNKITLTETNASGFSLIYFGQGNTGLAVGANYFFTRYIECMGNRPTSDSNYLLGDSLWNTNFANDIRDIFQENYIPTTDPYNKGGSSGTGGGTGTFDGTGDNVDFPSLPTLSASETGFISLFNPTLGQLKNLSSYMWSDAFSLDAFKKIFADPMDAILGLSIVPVDVPEGGSGEITVGNIPTGITMTKAASQYVEVDCGTLDVKEYWGAYLDYEPYTKAELYLPYCGIHPIKTDDIMNKSVHIKYHIDILSGACCAYVKCGESVLYTFSGSCSCSIPITSADFTSTIVGAISIASSIGTMVATGGMSAPISMGGIVDAVDSAASAADIVNMKPSVERSGSIGSMAGMLAIQTPYLILTRPNQCLPKYQNTYEGYPAYITETISNLSGYTIFEEIHLNDMSCTDAEKNEIENLLKSGVIL